MAKNSVSDWDTTAANNTDVGGVGSAGTSSIRLGDNAIREMMAQIASYTRAGADIASASTLNLDSIDTLWLAVTGTTTVTAVTLTEGHVRFVRATGAFQITAGASLIVNRSTTVNYTTTAGDLLFFEGYGSSVVRVWVISPTPATVPEMEAAADVNKFVTPARQQFHPSAAKGWCRFNGTGTIVNIVSHNLESLTDNGTGSYAVNWNVDFSSANYCAIASSNASETLGGSGITAGSTPIFTFSSSGSPSDASAINVVVFGDQ